MKLQELIFALQEIHDRTYCGHRRPETDFEVFAEDLSQALTNVLRVYTMQIAGKDVVVLATNADKHTDE